MKDEKGMLSALAWEAHRRGLTYGQLAATLEPGETGEIYRRWKTARKEREGLEMKNAAGQFQEWKYI